MTKKIGVKGKDERYKVGHWKHPPVYIQTSKSLALAESTSD